MLLPLFYGPSHDVERRCISGLLEIRLLRSQEKLIRIKPVSPFPAEESTTADGKAIKYTQHYRAELRHNWWLILEEALALQLLAYAENVRILGTKKIRAPQRLFTQVDQYDRC